MSSPRGALVLGATRDIGLAVAHELCAGGFRVAAVGRNRDALDELGRGSAVVPIVADLAEEGVLESAFAEAELALGAVSVLVNNASCDHRAPVTELHVALWDRVFSMNVRLPFLAMQRALPAMLEARWGRIVSVSSWVAGRPYPASGPYCASKAALEQLSRVVALEVAARDVTVNIVAPGSTDTSRYASDERRRRRVEGDPRELRPPLPRGRLASCDDVAAAVGFLASERAAHITGQVIGVDGGQSLV
jgi:NAD(P)-dependent dehydrogenase (short-subunit alcohol dehydrogenase family)